VWLLNWNAVFNTSSPVTPGNITYGLTTTSNGTPQYAIFKTNGTYLAGTPGFAFGGSYTALVSGSNPDYYLTGNITTTTGITHNSLSYFNAVRIA
jgi:hypothetical protein